MEEEERLKKAGQAVEEGEEGSKDGKENGSGKGGEDDEVEDQGSVDLEKEDGEVSDHASSKGGEGDDEEESVPPKRPVLGAAKTSKPS